MTAKRFVDLSKNTRLTHLKRNAKSFVEKRVVCALKTTQNGRLAKRFVSDSKNTQDECKKVCWCF